MSETKNKKPTVVAPTLLAAIAIFTVVLLLKSYGSFAISFFPWTIVVSDISWPSLFIVVLWAAAVRIPGAAKRIGAVIIVFAVLNAVFFEIKKVKMPPIEQQPVSAPQAAFRDFNLLVISIDSLRADRLGVYGYHRKTSPTMDALADRSALVENCYSQAPATLISHSTMFTGLYPGAHGAQCMTYTALPPSALSLTEILALNGYRTGGFTGGAQLGRFFGFSQGFETFDDEGGGFKGTWPRAKAWLDARGKEKFFLFLHTFDVHHPYKPPAPFARMFDPEYKGQIKDFIPIELLEAINDSTFKATKEDLAHISSVYDGGIRYADDFIAQILNHLIKTGLREKTIVVITSDHGEEFMEHGIEGMHAHTLYDELLHVPLIISIPGVAPMRVAPRVGLVDLPPTLLDILGISYPPNAFQGASFASYMSGSGGKGEAPRTLFAEKEHLVTETYGRMKSVRVGDWKFILKTQSPNERAFFRLFGSLAYPLGEKELYNVKVDPGEKHNLASANIQLSRAMENAVYEYMKENKNKALDPAEKVKAPQSEINKLKNLGYLK